MKLSEAVELEGYHLVIGDVAMLRDGPDGYRPLGEPVDGVAICADGVVICPNDCWDWAYSVSHEIAEHRHGFRHTAEMFAEQANILARWLRRATHAADQLADGRGVSCITHSESLSKRA